MNNYLSVSFKSKPEISGIITALLMDMGYEAAEEINDETIVSIKEDAFDEAALKEIMDPFNTVYTLTVVAPQNWNAQWESSFEPVQVDDFALIRASFHKKKETVLYDIIITPKMSFGTGHHATTYLVIQQMQELDFTNTSVIDFGTGTGVLAVLAEKLGAAAVYAIDNDEWSIENSRENIAANHCTVISLEMANEMRYKEKADIILANINLNVILENLAAIKNSLKSKGQVILSGLLASDEETISTALLANGFDIEKITHRNGWIAILTKPVVFPQY
jgi:ribosomal protein L11 methyltransferase